MEKEPVKIKMTLHAARPSIQGAEPPSASAQAAIDAVESRWRTEDRKAKKERRKKGIVGCLSWAVILLAAAGALWYFLGARYLPAEYTFPQVWQKMQDLYHSKTASKAEPEVDPADAAVANQRARLKAFVDLMEKVCEMKSPVQTVPGLVDKIKSSAGHRVLKEVVLVDAACMQAIQKLEAMNRKNEKIAAGQSGSAAAGARIGQYSAEDFSRQQKTVSQRKADCVKIRAQAVVRTIGAVKSATSKWTGPESKKDLAQMMARLEALSKKVG